MASETFVSAMLLVTGVVAAAILITAVLPIIWSMVGTFSSASAATDKSMRTDFKIVTTYAKISSGSGYQTGANVSVWMKNVGTSRIGATELKSADVIVGSSGNFGRVPLYMSTPYWPFQRVSNAALNYYWYYTLNEPTIPIAQQSWDPGETMQIDTFTIAGSITTSGQTVHFEFILPNGVVRSSEFTVNA